MQSNLLRADPVTTSPEPITRVLLIEPDAARAVILQTVLRPRLDADLVVVKGTEEALRSMATETPDLVLTSTFLTPADEATLTARLKELPGAAHVQVVNAPYFLDVNDASGNDSTGSKVMRFLGLRSAPIQQRCDVEMFQKQIEDYLEQAAVIRLERSQPRQIALVQTREVSGLWRSPLAQPGATGTLGGPLDVRLKFDPGRDRRRAHRRRGNDLPSLWTIRLPWGDASRIIDISTSGALLESRSKTTPGSTIDLRMLGQGMDRLVHARMIRADIAHVDGLGVKYHLAVAFSQEVALPDADSLLGAVAPPGADLPHGDEAAPSPRALADIVMRILGDVEHTSRAPELRTRFESDLRRLLRLRDVQIRDVPDGVSESIYFTIPRSSGASPILQVTFEPGRAPSEMDFRLLKAAANAAALVMEFVPLAPREGPRLLNP